MKFRNDGVPILKNSEIEEIAYELLRRYDYYYLCSPSKVPISGLLKYLKDYHDVTIEFSELGYEGNYRILGRTIFSKKIIAIDKILLDHEPLFLFTGAHEIGHWILHRHKQIKYKQQDKILDQIDDNENTFFLRKPLITACDWIEHHANIFAASLLMPREVFKEAVQNIQRDLGITRNVGKIRLDQQEQSMKDYKEIINQLQKIFGSSKRSINIRLKDLNILDDREKRGLIHITEIFINDH